MAREGDTMSTDRQGAVEQPQTGADRWLEAYRTMALIRSFEHNVDDLYKRALMPGLTHLYVGEEAIATGVCLSLTDRDLITSTHRGHGHCLAKGADVNRMFAELLGRVSGYCRGKGGSMHIADHTRGNLGANAIVGGSAAIATGAALSARMQGHDNVVVCFFGEGALGQGVLYESMNMAAIWNLPVIFVCENNQYCEYTFWRETTAGSITGRAAAFGIPGHDVDGQDVRAVDAATRAAVDRARSGEGPTLLVCETYRWYGHHVGDIDRAYYRSRDEEEDWKARRDPLVVLGEALIAEGATDRASLDEIEAACEAECVAAKTWALDEPFPAPEEVDMHVFAADS
jgi:pyruvate dehydrogenase E1 component alpha subunit